MKNKSIQTILSCLLALISFSGFAQQTQTEDHFKHRYIGIGIRAAGIHSSDLTFRAYPANRIILDINSNKYFRIEGQWGMYSKTQEAGPNNDVKLHTKSSYIGLGLMGMYPKEKARFIAGIRYGLNNYSDESVDFNPDPLVEKSSGKMKVLSFMIGGEYFLVKYFSVGAEFSLASVNDEFSPPSPESSSTEKSLLTEGNLVFRFYPF